MKNYLLIAILFLAFTAIAQAPLEKRKLQLNAGFGSSGWGTPLYIGLDYGLGNEFTCGVEASYQTYKYFDITSTIIGLQVNTNYHFNEILKISSKWDLYAGLGLNYYKWTIGNSNNLFTVIDDKPFGIAAQLGGRYFFSKKFGVNVELGGGNITSGGKLGITYKL